MTEQEIIEGLQNGKYKLEKLSVYNIPKDPQERVAENIINGLARNKRAHFEEGVCATFGHPPRKIKKTVFYFVTKTED